MQKLKEDLIHNWSNINHLCIAIYKGGSRIDPVINNPHDYDYICFAKPLQRHNLLRKLDSLGLSVCGSKKKVQKFFKENLSIVDFSQIRVYPYTQITWFSYLDILMEKVVGEDICPKTDIIFEHREEFIIELKKKMNALLNGIITNQKRWYHLLRGIYIILNNSYEVTPEQRIEINMLHDLSEGWQKIKDKTVKLLNDL